MTWLFNGLVKKRRDRQGKRLGEKSVYVCLCEKGERGTGKADQDDFITSASVCARVKGRSQVL